MNAFEEMFSVFFHCIMKAYAEVISNANGIVIKIKILNFLLLNFLFRFVMSVKDSSKRK